jgi:hypothetical protein
MKQLTIFLILTIISLSSGDNSQILSQTAGTVVDPASYNVKLVQNDPLVATCTVKPTLSPVDFVILEDTTGSMTDLINVLRTSFSDLFDGLSAIYFDPYFGVAQYKDRFDSFVYRREINLSPSKAAVQTAIDGLSAVGGGDIPEAVWNAIVNVSTGSTVLNLGMSFRSNSRRVMLIFNDAVSHDSSINSFYLNPIDVINALNAKNIVPIFFTSQVSYYSAFITQLGRGAALPINSTKAEFLNTIISTVGSILNVVNAGIFQTQDYIKSVSPTSVPFTTNDSIVFTVNLLAECKNRNNNIPDVNAYIDFTPGWGHCNFNISVVKCNQDPVCSKASVVDRLLWPPNHKYVNVPIQGVTDPDGDPVTIKITGILQNENTNGGGDGNTCPDGTGVGTGSASVRVERSGNLFGRVYRILFKATDSFGASCTGFVEVCVPHDQGNDSSCENAPAATIDSTVCH